MYKYSEYKDYIMWESVQALFDLGSMIILSIGLIAFPLTIILAKFTGKVF